MRRLYPNTKPPKFGPRTVLAYHGCSREIADRIVEAGHFFPSTNKYDWLGAGIYFWEYAPHRALDWAKLRYETQGIEPAVIGVTIRLGDCLNLLDTASGPLLRGVYELLEQEYGTRRMPRNTNTGAHFLDRLVIDEYCSSTEANGGKIYQTVRGCYPEGEPIYPNSKILSLAHVQIAVRDPSCISDIHHVTFPPDTKIERGQ